MPLAATYVWLVALNEVPFHQRFVVVFSMANVTPVIVVPVPAFEAAVPVIAPVQVVDQYLALFGT